MPENIFEYMKRIDEEEKILAGDYDLAQYDDDEGGLAQNEEY